MGILGFGSFNPLLRDKKGLLDIDEILGRKPPSLVDQTPGAGFDFSKIDTGGSASRTNFDYGDISGGGTQPTLPSYDPTRVSSTGRIQNRLPEFQEMAAKSDSLGTHNLGATRMTPSPTPAPPSPAPSPAPSRPPTIRPPMDFARNDVPFPPTRPEGTGSPPYPPTRPAGLGGPPLPPSRQLALGEPNLPRTPDVPPPNIPRGALAAPPEIASTRAAGNDINAGPTGAVKAPMNRSLNMNEIPRGYGYWDDGTVRNAQGQSAPIYGPTRGEAASDILSKMNPAAGSASLPTLGGAAKTINTIDSNALKPAIQSGMLGPTAPALGTAIPQQPASPAIVGPPVGSAIPGADKDKDTDSAMPDIMDSDFAQGGSSEGGGGIMDSDFAGGGMGDMMGGMGGGMGALSGILGLAGSLMGGGKKDSGFDPPPKAPSVPPPGAASGPEMQRAAAEKQSAQQILSGILAGNQHSLLDRKRPYT